MLFDTCVKIEFEPMKQEHSILYNHSDNSLDKYRKKAIRCEFSKEEELIFELLMDIKQSIQNISKKPLDPLATNSLMVKIDYDTFQIYDNVLEVGQVYFARVFFDELMYFYFEALDSNYAKITKIKSMDDSRLASYIVNLQRMMINDKRRSGDEC